MDKDTKFFDELRKSLVDALTSNGSGDGGGKGGDGDGSGDGDGDAVTPEALEEVTKQLASLAKATSAIAAVLDPGEQKDTDGDEVEWEREPGSLIKAITEIKERVDTHHTVLENVTEFTSALNKRFAKSKQPDGDDGAGDGDGGSKMLTDEQAIVKARHELDFAVGVAAKTNTALTLV